MRIVEPKAELMLQGDGKMAAVEHVARCASVCYQSSPKRGEDALAFYNGLISSGHLSMLRHESVYYIIPLDKLCVDHFNLQYLKLCPYCDYVLADGGVFIATNAQFVLEHLDMFTRITPYKVAPGVFAATETGKQMMRYTFCLTTQISTSRELNRVSPNSIAEMSTRYIKFGGKVEPSVVRPHWMSKEDADMWNIKRIASDDAYTAIEAWSHAFNSYTRMLCSGHKKEDARGILPLDTMTKVIYTYSVEEWRHIINLRYHGTTGKPHGNAQLVIGMVKEQLEKIGYNFDKE